METEPNTEPTQNPTSLHWAILGIGTFLVLGTALLAGRLIWEMTWLTWQMGPQMVGFSLSHGYGVFLFFFPVGLVVWQIAAAIIVIVWKVRRRKVLRRSWLALGAGALMIGALSIPQTFWNRVFVAELAKSSSASELLVDAAADGELTTVQSMIKRGVPVDARSHDGSTALGLAAATGQTKVVQFLVSKGADINATSLYGDSPLERASENHQQPVRDFLSAKGALALKGDEAQRERASQIIVHRDIEESEQREKARGNSH
jgi:hypothetical protein